MTTGIRTLQAAWLRQATPPALRRLANRLLGALTRYEGPYDTWEDASEHSVGYDHEAILARVSAAAEKVLRGEAKFEQDGRPMQGEPGSSHALQALLLAAASDSGLLSVLDFGGGLGSHYLRWRGWLEALPGIRWIVIEQSHFVAAGTRLLAGIPAISFASSVGQARGFSPNAILASSVLQYLPDPLAILTDLVSLRPRVIVIDRTPFSLDGNAHILSQHVPKSLGATSYPLWTLSRGEVHAALGDCYHLLSEFPSADAPIAAGHIRASYRGCVWMRKN